MVKESFGLPDNSFNLSILLQWNLELVEIWKEIEGVIIEETCC